MRTAVYAGSFDPLTNGHLWMIEKGLEMFDHLYVAIGSNPAKSYTFSVQDRIDMLEDSIPSCDRLTISEFKNLYLVEYARSVEAQYILRGIRSSGDYEYERVMRHINADMAPSITTTFLMPPRDIAELSSSMVKSLIGPEGWEESVKRYVPSAVFTALQKRN
ncbi:MAG: pantetheine-phosphate adenylyltransferase [Akkermansiaceae bacterium]|nr:pantetheine-phosphate adenylyltransferase [Akkermansiaceae bacterium]